MTFPLGHLPGISDSLGSRWSTQLSPETRPFSHVYYLVIHPDAQSRVLPTPQAVIHHVLLFQTTHCYLVTILSGEDIYLHSCPNWSPYCQPCPLPLHHPAGAIFKQQESDSANPPPETHQQLLFILRKKPQLLHLL